MNTEPSGTSRAFTALDEAETDRLAAAVAHHCVEGTVIGLCGTLGAGKTRFVQGLAEALGIPRSQVTSPTFVLCHEYHGPLTVFHYDAYRLESVDDWLRLGVEEQIGYDGVSVIEWSDRVAEWLPDDRLEVDIEICGETARKFTLRAGGHDSGRILKALETLPFRAADAE